MENRNLSIVGAGGKGAAAGRTPVESPDSLRSISYAKTIILLGEGEMRGLVNGYRSVYLQGTPLQNSDGTFNFQNVAVETRSGTQDQSYIPGFPSVENEVIVGVELRADTPIVRTVSGSDLSAVRVRVAVDSLRKVDTSNGDTVGYSVSYAIDVATDGGAYTTVLNSAFTGKTTTQYERSHRIDLPAGSQWQIRIRRLTPNANSSTVADTTRVQSITEIIDAKLRYPNSALLAVSVDAQQFQRLPTIACNVYGRIIKVPANYDPELRTYATTGPGTTNGVWNGTFKSAWTNNPAWVFYDIVTNDRFGLGNNIPAAWVDAWNLYQIAQYCDEMVSDGFGGKEPRFTCNVYMQTRADAYKVLQDLAAVFRGVTYYAVGQMIASADMPKQVSVGYTNADVVDGRFEYESSAKKVRHTVALVSWSDQTDMGRQKVERVEFRPGLIRYGIQETEVTAIGCTSRGQAQRIGNHILVSENLERETIAFKVGLEGVLVSPGDVFNVSNRNRAGRRMGGRISAFTADSVTVDQIPYDIVSGDTIKVMLSTGKIEARTIQSVSGRVVTVTVDWSSNPAKQGVFIFEKTELVAETFRCMGVADNEDGTYTISGLSYRADKFAYIDDGTRLEQPPISVIPPSVQAPPTNVTLTSFSVIDQANARTDVTIQWDAAPNAIEYEVEWRRDDMDWVRVGRVSSTSVDIRGAYTGQYLSRVRAVNALGARSIPSSSALTQIEGKTTPPPALTSLTTQGIVFGIRLAWGMPQGATDTERTEIWYGPGPDLENAIKLGDFAYPQNTHQINGLAAGVQFFFWGRLVDRSGNIGPWYPDGAGVVGQSSADANEILDYLTGQITATQLGQQLLSEIELISADSTVAGSVNQRLDTAVDDLNSKINSINAQIADIMRAPEFNPADAYSENQLVKYEGGLYRARQNIAAPAPLPTNETYWEKIGDYDSLGEAVAALSATVSQQSSKLNIIDGQITAINTRYDAILVSVNGNTAAIQSEQTARINADGALGTRIDNVTATANSALGSSQTNAANISSEATARANADSALGLRIDSVVATAGGNTAAIQAEAQARADADGAAATRIDGLYTQVTPKGAGNTNWGAGDTTTYAGSITVQSVFSGLNLAQSQRIDTVVASVDANAALLVSEQTARVNADSALATRIDTTQASVGNVSAIVQQNSSAIVGLDGRLDATYTIKAQVSSGGQIYAAGMGLGVEQQPDGSYQSQILMQADRFAVINVANGQVTSPFVIQGGQTFISQALIGTGWIKNAMIGNIIQSNATGQGGQPRWILDKDGTLTMNGPNNGGYLTINDRVIRVYDPAGTLRVQLGIWS